jgi:hypothetical protein
MAFQKGVLVRNAELNAINTELGATATLKLFTGAEPANCAAADPAGTLVTINLPATPFTTASAGAIALSGTWSGTASAGGLAASFRIYDSSAVCQMQGAIPGDMTLNNANIANTQTVTVNTFGITAGNA